MVGTNRQVKMSIDYYVYLRLAEISGAEPPKVRRPMPSHETAPADCASGPPYSLWRAPACLALPGCPALWAHSPLVNCGSAASGMRADAIQPISKVRRQHCTLDVHYRRYHLSATCNHIHRSITSPLHNPTSQHEIPGSTSHHSNPTKLTTAFYVRRYRECPRVDGSGR